VSAPSAFRRSRTLKTEHFHIDKYIDQWWKRHKLPEDAAEKEARLLKEKQQREAEEKEKGPIITDGIDTKARVWQVAEVDERVHHFIHELLMLGEDDPAVKNGVHLHKFMIQHQERILAVKEAIKPGILSIFMEPFDKNMMKRYFRALKHKAVVPDKERLKKELINQLHTDIELGVKSPNYYDLGVGHEQAEKARLMKKFQNMAPGIRGGEKVGTNKVLHIGPDEHHAE